MKQAENLKAGASKNTINDRIGFKYALASYWIDKETQEGGPKYYNSL
jgi:hypothetical protein